ncbi:MAG: sugar transferase [Phycisphaerales bacterium]|nr:sugar transferase [Phycisphaerales bacterium]
MWARGPKRLFDVLVGLLLLISTFPFVVVAIGVIGLTSPGPVFFRQTRTGRHGLTFRPWKLRTMRAGRRPDPDEIVTTAHPDVTPVTRILRRLRVDELPQLINVLTGDMSLVGPRPTLPEQTAAYDEFQRLRLLVRPGITGLAQVNGNTTIPWEERIKYDVHYVRHHDLWMDVGILFKTFAAVFDESRSAGKFEDSRYGRLKNVNDVRDAG